MNNHQPTRKGKTMENFQDQDEAIEAVMERLDGLQEEKLALFFLNIFGKDGLMEMAQDIMESRAYEFDSEKDVDDFINHMIS